VARFNFDPSASVIVVDCEFRQADIRIHANLVFDTGATYTMISWAIADKLGLNPQKSRSSVPFHTASGHVEAPLVRLEELNVKGARVFHLDLIVHDLPEEARVDGLLGLNFLKNFSVNLDFQKGVGTIE